MVEFHFQAPLGAECLICLLVRRFLNISSLHLHTGTRWDIAQNAFLHHRMENDVVMAEALSIDLHMFLLFASGTLFLGRYVFSILNSLLGG